MSQFLRRVEIQIQRPGGEARSLEGLHVTARTKRSVTQTPDASTVTIYGAAPGSVADLQTPGCVLRVLAGYRGLNGAGGSFAALLGGTVRPGTLEVIRQMGEVVVVAEVVESRLDVRAKALSRAWDQALASEVVAWAISAAGLSTGVVRLAKDVSYTRGFSFVGVAGDLLRQIAQDTGSTLIIQDGVVSLYPSTEERRPTSLLLSPGSGLIGSPRRVDEGRVEAVTLLAPTLRPGDGYRVQADQFGGDYRAIDVEHEIDSRQGPFFTRVVGVRL